MHGQVKILIAEDDPGHAVLIQKNLRRAGLINEIIHFKDGQEVLDFFFNGKDFSLEEEQTGYLLLLDIRMPKVDGVDVLRRLKQTPGLKRIPIIMLTTTDDPREVEKCHECGCSHYVTKPVQYDVFMEAIHQLGLFLTIVEVPGIGHWKNQSGGIQP